MKRISLLVLLCLTIFPAFALHAQDATDDAIATIPLDSIAANIALSPDDHTLAVYNNAVAYNDSPDPELIAVRLIDLNTGDEIGILNDFTDWVIDADFNSDGTQLVTFHRNGDINLWDVPNQSHIKTIYTYAIGAGWVQFLPNDHSVLYRMSEFIIGILDLDSSAITHLFSQHVDTFEEFSEIYTQYPGRGEISFAAARVSPDGQWLATSSSSDTVYLWKIATGERWQLRASSERPMRFSIRAFAFSADSSHLIYYDSDTGTTHVWDVNSREEVGVYDFGAEAFALAPNDTTLVWLERETGTLYTTSLMTDTEPVALLTLPEGLRVAPPIVDLAFTSDGSKLLISGLLASDAENAIYVIDRAR